MPQSTDDGYDIDSVEDVERDSAAIAAALRRSVKVFLVLTLVMAPVAWWLSRPAPQPAVRASVVELPQLRERPPVEAPRAAFTEITSEAGVSFVHENGAAGEKLLPETMGGGCAFLDYDSDGDQDILFVNSCRWPWDQRPLASPATMALFANDGRGRFQDVTAAAGLAVTFYGMGVAAGDYDNDGRVDLFISAVGPNHLFHNEGGRFADVTSSSGVAGAEQAWSSSCAWLDYNNDGRLDLLVGNYVQWSREIDIAQDFRLVGVGRAYGPPTSFGGAFPYLYRNEGQGRFTEVSQEAGLHIVNPNTGVPAAKTLGLAPVDIDGDGWIDIVVANDTVQNFVLLNSRDGTFRETGADTGIAFDAMGNARGAMGIDTANFRNNRSLGVAIGNFANEMTALYVAQDDPLQFVDLAVATGLGPATRLQLTFGVVFVDYDLDGRPDLLTSNGHLESEINKVQVSQHYAQAPQLFWNCGPNKACEFQPVRADQCGSDLVRPMVGRGSALADIDGDGDQDLLLTAVGGPARLLRNDQQLGHQWLRFKLVGRSCNRDAIGAWVEVTSDGELLRRQVMPTKSYLSQSELPVTIGLGTRKRIERVQIRWPDGQMQMVPQHSLGETTVVEQAPLSET
jgi:hypothetical protein